jgi:hypothetical protein
MGYILRDKYWIPWNDETTVYYKRCLEQLAFGISIHSDTSFETAKEKLYRLVGYMSRKKN